MEVLSDEDKRHASSAPKQPLLHIANDCPICGEKLISITDEKKVGATVPCGHCFHWDCFQKWKHESSRLWKVPCPICMKLTNNFFRIYITTEINRDAVEGVEQEIVDEMKKSSAENDSLKQGIAQLTEAMDDMEECRRENEWLKKEVARLKKVTQSNWRPGHDNGSNDDNSNAMTLHTSLSNGIGQLWRGLQYMRTCALRSCREGDDESQSMSPTSNTQRNDAFVEYTSEDTSYDDYDDYDDDISLAHSSSDDSYGHGVARLTHQHPYSFLYDSAYDIEDFALLPHFRRSSRLHYSPHDISLRRRIMLRPRSAGSASQTHNPPHNEGNSQSEDGSVHQIV